MTVGVSMLRSLPCGTVTMTVFATMVPVRPRILSR